MSKRSKATFKSKYGKTTFLKKDKPPIVTEDVRFVSNYKYFDDEKSGKKPYIVRNWRNMNQFYKERIMRFIDNRINLMIVISRAYTQNNIANLCTHALLWKDDVILAWNPNEGMHDV